MRHLTCGFFLSGMATLVMTFFAPLPVGADFILSGTAAGDVKSMPDGQSAPPVPTDQVPSSDPVPHGNVGYAITTEEFVGGVICLALFVGAAVYSCLPKN